MENILKARGLVKYFGKNKILDNVDLNVYEGEIMGFLGPNGAGKTTAIKIILGFLSADAGTVEINGKKVQDNYEEAMGVVGGIVENPDMYKNFSGTLNLRMYARTHEGVTEERIKEVAKLVGLEDRIDDKVKKYSLGMKQRLGLAQALLHKPRLLILDEPTNGLDPAGIKELRDILTNISRNDGVGVLVSSHQLAEMQLMCDRVTIITKGKIICEKTMKELSETPDGVAIYKLTVKNPSIAVAQLGGYSPLVDGETGVVSFSAKPEEIDKIVKNIADANAGIQELVREKNSLEDAFIAITQGGKTNE